MLLCIGCRIDKGNPPSHRIEPLPLVPAPLKIPEQHGSRDCTIRLLHRIHILQRVAAMKTRSFQVEYLVRKPLPRGNTLEQRLQRLCVDIGPLLIYILRFRPVRELREFLGNPGPLLHDPARSHARIKIARRIHGLIIAAKFPIRDTIRC